MQWSGLLTCDHRVLVQISLYAVVDFPRINNSFLKVFYILNIYIYIYELWNMRQNKQ